IPAPPFYYADNDHQQYLAKNPEGYCGLGGTGIQLLGSEYTNERLSPIG
ncbi:MAG: peptide-methionine (S)-S-oxide reductase, partial [Methylococcales bacterium]|nr:peptide-methionine (S)-S-oxide reductase [Methylococcales bacterium]